MEEIKEVPTALREWERVSAHSHITGLGLDGLKARPIGAGMVGQTEAREAAGIIVEMVKKGKFAGRAILIAGPPGTGKTALAVAIAKELGRDVPFMPVAASEIFSAEIKKTEFLTQALRKAIGIRIHEMRRVYEGKVEELNIRQEPHPYNPYTKIPVGGTIKLSTTDATQKLSMDQSFAISLLRQGVETGDVVQIDVDSGRVVKLGKSKEAAEKEKLDLTTVQVVDIPSGPVLKHKEFVYTLTLHDIDVTQSRAGVSMFSLLFGGEERKEISAETRASVDELVRQWVQEGRAEILPGVVFIDECSMLDIEAFSFLNRAMEQELAPIVIFATNRGITLVRGTDLRSPHGLPLDLLDRLLIINTRPYSRSEILEILKIRSRTEKISLTDEALNYLADIGEQTSLRYSVQLLAPASEIAARENAKKVSKQHVERARQMFVDVSRSVKHLQEFEEKMLK
ncbi:MAG: TATA box-binding protein [Hadesarchaea archaeon YNP_N21]|jgi:TBP-interacting protein|nr:MAG: TATA box-binding protein [Hadesarchaea archaeon YNP_N21]